MKNIFDPTKGNANKYTPTSTNQLAGIQTDNITSQLGGLGLTEDQMRQLMAIIKG